MDLDRLTQQEKRSKRYAREFFEEEWEMEGIWEMDTQILDSVLKKGKLLDIAMGPGRHVKHYAAKGFKVWGNDFNKHMVSRAKRYVRNKNVNYMCHDMRRLEDVKSNYFDSVICMGASLGSIYRGRERQKAVREMARVVKPGGIVVLHGHNLFEISESEDIRGFMKLIKNRILHPFTFEFGDVVYNHSSIFKKAYMHWFSGRELKGLMRKSGLRIEREYRLRSPDQDKLLKKTSWPLRTIRTGGYIMVGRKK